MAGGLGPWGALAYLGLGLAGLGAAAPAGPQPATDPDQAGVGAPLAARGLPIASQRVSTAVCEPVVVLHYLDVDGACAPTAAALRLVEAPAHGVVTFEQGWERPSRRGRPLFESGDPRSVCSDRLAPARDVVYAPGPAFAGQDRFVVEITEAGQSFTDAVVVEVVGPARGVRTAAANASRAGARCEGE
jgi:hypothetical protein